MTKNLADAFGDSQSRGVVQKIVHACQEAKGQDLAVLDVKKIFDLSDYFIVVSGRSDRQVQGISNKIIEALIQEGIAPVVIEGLDEGQWVLLDFGNVIVHVFYEATRHYYDFDALWARALRIEIADGSVIKKARVAA